MEDMYKIYSEKDNRIPLKILPGHFATTQSHITHYLDMTTMKTRCSEAQRIADVLASAYGSSTPIDTIVCLDATEVIGAFLAETLTRSGVISVNAHQTMYIVSPEIIHNGQLVFRDNNKMMIEGKNIMILAGSITTGNTLANTINSLLYYGGKITGIAAIFSAISKVADMPVLSVFSRRDIPGYTTYSSHNCPLCKEGKRVDGLVSGYGFSKL
jgi:orotate phosphoribosyltransferase